MPDIIVNKPVLTGQKLTSKFQVPNEYHKFLKHKELFVEYDENICAEESILNIPSTAAMLPLAWLTGSNIRVGKIDRRFKEAMDSLQTVFKKMYPQAPFITKIHAEELVENEIKLENPDRCTGLLFSGGVDSAYTLINNIKLSPRLIMLWGIDDFPYPERAPHWEKTISIYSEYAKRKNLDYNVVKTNISQILDDRRIEHKYHKELFDGRLKPSINHSIVLILTLAPLSIGRYSQLIIAASFPHEYNFTNRPRAAIQKIDEKIVYADLNVINDGAILRKEKIRALKDSLNNDLILRVCLRSKLVNGDINDSTCEKCLRTIGLLVLAGIDPNKCGFSVDESTFKGMRSYWEKTKTSRFSPGWHDIQRLVPDNIDHDIYGSRDFFEWFRNFNFESSKKNWFYTNLYMNLPYTLSKYLDIVYRKRGINVHEGAFVREVKQQENS